MNSAVLHPFTAGLALRWRLMSAAYASTPLVADAHRPGHHVLDTPRVRGTGTGLAATPTAVAHLLGTLTMPPLVYRCGG